MKLWADWEKANAASFPDTGGMVGKTKRVTKDGVSEAQNAICGSSRPRRRRASL